MPRFYSLDEDEFAPWLKDLDILYLLILLINQNLQWKNFVEFNLRYSKAFEADCWLSAVIGSASQLDGY